MSLRILVLVVLYVAMGMVQAEDTHDLEQCMARVASCESRSTSQKPVCGSDGITYPTLCVLLRAQCSRNGSKTRIELKNRGKCRPAKTQQQCFANLEYARKHPAANGHVQFLPACRPDGTYAPVQCHRDTGYCWCVNERGQPVPNTAVRRSSSGKPQCGKHGKSSMRRRSSSRTRRQKRGCTLLDKDLFNNNLIDNFHTEWARIHASDGLIGAELDRVVLEWKFKDMDKNWDGKLDKSEYRDLRKLVKKFVKPKRCSKSFARTCDTDRDQQISRQEWNDCLKRDDINDEKRSGASVEDDGEADEDKDEDNEEDYEGDDLDEEDFMHGSRRSPPHGLLLTGGTLSGSSQTFDDSSEHRDDEATDCLSDRQAVLNEQRADNLYVPECTPDGRYKKIQCYKSVGYCWCVHEDTGKNIPGTSVQHAIPKCDQMPMPNRPMKGCPEPKKTVFLRDLMEFLHNRMLSGTNDTNITGSESGSWQASKEEKAATWNFVVLDKNKNKVLERKEWKTFRALVSSTKQLRRCGKKLPRYCDVNNDRKISLSEWLECLNTKRITPETINPKAASQRRGKNPLHSILKDD